MVFIATGTPCPGCLGCLVCPLGCLGCLGCLRCLGRLGCPLGCLVCLVSGVEETWEAGSSTLGVWLMCCLGPRVSEADAAAAALTPSSSSLGRDDCGIFLGPRAPLGTPLSWYVLKIRINFTIFMKSDVWFFKPFFLYKSFPKCYFSGWSEKLPIIFIPPNSQHPSLLNLSFG